MKEKISPYLRKLLARHGIAAQYTAGTTPEFSRFTDPLAEDSHEPVKGLIHKYPNRVLVKVSYQCAAHCRFCTRIRQIGNPEGTLGPAEVEAISAYIVRHPEIEEVILSGGDALYTPKITQTVLEALLPLPQIKVFRIATRLPFQLPDAVRSPALQPLLQLIDSAGYDRPVFMLLHANHPDELTAESLLAISVLRRLKVTLLSQTVFLRGINDDEHLLHDLFTRLYHAGVIPYYIYHCDAVAGLERFTVPLADEQRIMTALHARLSGIACPRHVVDIEGGYGKLTVPQRFFGASLSEVQDFYGNEFRLAAPETAHPADCAETAINTR